MVDIHGLLAIDFHAARVTASGADGTVLGLCLLITDLRSPIAAKDRRDVDGAQLRQEPHRRGECSAGATPQTGAGGERSGEQAIGSEGLR